jgi:hypothetical protein
MYIDKINELSKRLERLNQIFDSKKYNPVDLKKDFLELDKEWAILLEEIEKETGKKWDED